ncbi:hypothetical protein FH972_023794 [Carpinus fangiana]|uniref:Uncharacterized protein n=1 Tax=Carpinus fangiana TaxID=176857 RepID=A0A5N6KYP7_9ROSI|nr:hypothetical protein FH972_023794 [Carpinus fangiana]
MAVMAMARCPPKSYRTPPATIPVISPNACAEETQPIALGARSAGTVSVTKAMPEDMMKAAEQPCRNRAATMTGAAVAAKKAKVARHKVTSPQVKGRRPGNNGRTHKIAEEDVLGQISKNDGFSIDKAALYRKRSTRDDKYYESRGVEESANHHGQVPTVKKVCTIVSVDSKQWRQRKQQ